MKRIHLIGVGGVGMAGLAVLLARRGAAVSGCDLGSAKRLEFLAHSGIAVFRGHDPAHLEGVDEVIVTPAVSAANPELAAARAGGVRVRSRGETLAALVSAAEDSVAVCGSHGKTTTATFIARLLLALGERVEWAIGGETGGFPVAGIAGDGSRRSVLVVEADESDGTLSRYRAGVLVVTNCDFDHPDHFPDRAAYVACYDAARRQARSVIEAEALADIGDPQLAFLSALPAHNRRNARAAVEVALRRGHPLAAIAERLPAVVRELPDRRFERLADGVYTDYAHHPAELVCALAMARAQVAPGARLRVLFQPHRYSRTLALKREFAAVLAAADETVICPVYAAFEPPLVGGDAADLYAACRERGGGVTYLARDCREAWEHAARTRRPGDVTLLAGAGDIIALADMVRTGELPPPRRIPVGMGTNTWRSDLDLAEEYVRTGSPAGRPGAELLRDPQLGPAIAWMAGIPGTVGGWVKMNAGAFGHSISEVVARVKVDGRWLAASECGFGYRTSAITGMIEEVEWRKPEPAAESAAAYLARRLPFPPGTKGSVFRNPPGDYAGRLLEAAGAKGLKVGGARVWERHANVIVTDASATASDFLALSRLMFLAVFTRFGIALTPEVCGLPRW